MMSILLRKTIVFTLVLGLSIIGLGGMADAEKVTLNFMADSRSEFVKMQKLLPEFTKETGISVNMVALQETPLRAKTGLELSAPSTEMNIIMTDFQLMKKYAERRRAGAPG